MYLILAYLGLFTFGLLDNFRGPVYKDILDYFGISKTLGAQIFALSSLSSLFTTFFAHSWIKYLGTVRSKKYSCLFLFLGTIFFAISGFLKSKVILLLGSLIYGIGMGGQSVCTNLLVALAVSIKFRRRALSGLHAMYGLAALIAPLFALLLAKFHYSWQMGFLILSFFPFISFLLSMHQQHFGDELPLDKFHDYTPIPKKLRAKVALICIMFSTYVSSEVSISTRLPIFLRETYFLDNSQASLWLAIFFFLLFLGRIIFGSITYSARSSHLLFVSALFSTVFYFLGLVYHPYFLVGTAMAMSIFFPCGMDWINELFGRYSARVIGLMMSSVSILLFITHGLIGILADQFSIKFALFIGPLFLLICLISLLMINFFCEKINPTGKAKGYK